MKRGLGLVVMAFSAGLFADAAHGSPVYEWTYAGPGSSHFGSWDDDHDGDHETHHFRAGNLPYSGPSSRHGTSSPHSDFSFAPRHSSSWNDGIDRVHDWGRSSYLPWSLTWSGGNDPGPRRNSWAWCDPGDGHSRPPVSTVPVPAAAVLFGSGLAFLFGVGQRKKHRPKAPEEA
jgi:hypothetical protein